MNSLSKMVLTFYAPCSQWFICPKIVIKVQFIQFSDGFFLDNAWVFWCLMEIQIPSEYFITTFTTQNHLDSHGLDNSSHQKHRCWCTNCGDIISFGGGRSHRWSHRCHSWIVKLISWWIEPMIHFFCSYQIRAPFSPTAKECNCGYQASDYLVFSIRLENFLAMVDIVATKPPEKQYTIRNITQSIVCTASSSPLRKVVYVSLLSFWHFLNSIQSREYHFFISPSVEK